MQFFDLITAVTISGILGIIAVYLVVVYKKGWLKRNSVESHFLCPNPKCRKIFTEPVWLTDLSRVPAESYPACPNCSINLNTIPFFNAQKRPKLKGQEQTLPTRDARRPIERQQLVRREATAQTTQATAEKPAVVEKPVLELADSVQAKDYNRKPAESVESKPFVPSFELRDETLSKITDKFKGKDEKKSSPSSKDCAHFFGYVRRLPKNTPIPDECLGCPWIVDCLTKEAEQVEI